ncbi:hypothetical protein BGLA2_1000086 [Burkholderia gladioli]|nr:hypothetical protein BGLA2_1000086 [Burkholderia gladioli]
MARRAEVDPRRRARRLRGTGGIGGIARRRTPRARDARRPRLRARRRGRLRGRHRHLPRGDRRGRRDGLGGWGLNYRPGGRAPKLARFIARVFVSLFLAA